MVHLSIPALAALLLLAPLPSEEQVRAVRTAWIAERMGNVDGARRIFLEAIDTWPGDPYLLDETLQFLSRTGGDAAHVARHGMACVRGGAATLHCAAC